MSETQPEYLPQNQEAKEISLTDIHKEIQCEEQEAHALLSFFEAHDHYLVPGGFLSQQMLASGLPPYGARLAELFSDLPYDGSLEETVTGLEKLGQEEVYRRWKLFVKEVRDIHRTAPRSDRVEAVHWVLGPLANPLPLTANFLHPDHGQVAWFFFHEEHLPLLRHIAAFATLEREYARKVQEMKAHWLGENETMIVVGKNAPAGKMEELFGPKGPEALRDLLPPSLQKALRCISFTGYRKPKKTKEHRQERQKHLLGKFDRETRTLSFLLTEETTAEEILHTLIHELGHALIAGISKTDQDIRRAFLHAVATCDHLVEDYAGDSYQRVGIVEGLEEDFAESFRYFFLDPRGFQRNEPERFAVLQQIFTEHLPDVDLEQIRRKFYVFSKEAGARKKPV
jgi:hypothetical protein